MEILVSQIGHHRKWYINCIRSYYTLLILELKVTISVSYNPPSDAVLGPNEYRAASGPVTVTCTAIGGTGSISYQWSSDCRSCPFQTTISRTITRGAVHSGGNGIHTCTATTAQGVGNASINVTVVGEHAFSLRLSLSNTIACNCIFRCRDTCLPWHTNGLFSNNDLVSLNPMDMKFRLRLFCRSDSMMEDVGKLIGLNGSPIVTHDSSFFNISNPQPGELYVENIANSTNLTDSGQGVYTCRIPLQSGETREINIGIYPSGFRSE